MALNHPYAKFVEGRNVLDLIKTTPHRLHELADALGEGGLEESLAPGKWSARLILCHMADTEIAFSFRLRQALAEENHVVQPFDQDAWARKYDSTMNAEAALDVFSALRKWNAGLIESSASEWKRPVRHPERGEMTFGTLVEIMAGHDQNHLRQLERIAQIKV